MSVRRVSALALLALALAGCSSTAATLPPPTPAQATAAPATAAPRPTLPPAPTSLPTSAPEPTDAPTQPPPTSLPEPTAAPTQPPPPTVAPTQVPPTAAPTAAPTQPPPPTAAPSGPRPEELLFLRGGALWAAAVGQKGERKIADGVADFAPSPDGAQVALVRGEGLRAELWVVARDGSGLRQLTRNGRAESGPGWANDGSALVYGSSADAGEPGQDWVSWSRRCARSEVRQLDVATGAEQSLAAGCDPAISPDGRRIAFSGPPAAAAQGAGPDGPLQANALRLINRRGENGWSFATASGRGPEGDGLVVYNPAWSPDGALVAYHRYMGMQVEVDVNLTEVGKSFQGKGQPIGDGAGWLLPSRFSPDGRLVATTENDYGNARGLEGYGAWSVTVVRLEGSREIPLPSGPLTVQGQQVERIAGAQRLAWAPAGGAAAVELPAGWSRGGDPEAWGSGAGEVWRWVPGSGPAERIAADVDFASPLAWLPASR